MGEQPKLLLPFRATTVLETTLAQLCAADIGQVHVVTGYRREILTPILQQFPVQEVFNPDFILGMTSSIQAGINAAVEGRGYMICLADMPTITTAAYKLLAKHYFEQILDSIQN